jgi:hypothetical protein
VVAVSDGDDCMSVEDVEEIIDEALAEFREEHADRLEETMELAERATDVAEYQKERYEILREVVVARTAANANVFIGYGLKRDQYHDRARAIVQGFDGGRPPEGHGTNYVLSGVLNIIGERVGHETGIELLDAIIESAGFEIVHLPLPTITPP